MLAAFVGLSAAREISIADFGAIASDPSVATGQRNMAAANAALGNASRGDTVLIPPGDWYTLGGIALRDRAGVTLRVEGTLHAIADFDAWPMADGGRRFADILSFSNCSDLVVTAGGTSGTIDGAGKKWWNKWVLDPLPAHRPTMLNVSSSDNTLVEGLRLKNAPNFHILLSDANGAEVRFVHISVDRSGMAAAKAVLRTKRQAVAAAAAAAALLERGGVAAVAAAAAAVGGGGVGGFPLQPEDLNTDGIDASGQNVWVHDVVIDNDDDSIAVKPCHAGSCRSACSQNMLFENLVLTGFGASIGSVPPTQPHPNCVRNITFRNVTMPETGKGIYVKSNPSCAFNASAGEARKTASITDVLFEDFRIVNPRWWAIWIGPQQQHEPGSALSDKCAIDYPISGACPTQGCVTFDNITLRNVLVEGTPWLSPGVVLGNASNPMTNIVFDNVTVTKPGGFPFLGEYKCESTFGLVTDSFPVPKCIRSSARVPGAK